MKLAAVIPVINQTKEALKEAQSYLKQFVSSDVEISVYYLEKGVETIETETDILISSIALMDLAVELENKGYDGIYISCFGDPGLRAIREIVKIPVIGAFESTLSVALNVGDNITIFATDRGIITEMAYKIRTAGLSSRVTSVVNMNIDIADVFSYDSSDKKIINHLSKLVESSIENGSEVIVIGCGAFTKVVVDLNKKINGDKYTIPILEPDAICISTLESLVRNQIVASPLTYRCKKI